METLPAAGCGVNEAIVLLSYLLFEKNKQKTELNSFNMDKLMLLNCSYEDVCLGKVNNLVWWCTGEHKMQKGGKTMNVWNYHKLSKVINWNIIGFHPWDLMSKTEKESPIFLQYT